MQTYALLTSLHMLMTDKPKVSCVVLTVYFEALQVEGSLADHRTVSCFCLGNVCPVSASDRQFVYMNRGPRASMCMLWHARL